MIQPFLSFPRKRPVTGGGGSDATATYESQAAFTASSGGVTTLSAQDVGSTGDIAVGIWGTAGATRTISSVTVDGNACTLVPVLDSALRIGYFALVARGAIGSTADIVITWSANITRGCINAWTVTDLASFTASDTAGDDPGSSSSNSISIDTPAGGICLAMAVTNGGTRTPTWSGIVEDHHTAFETIRTNTAASQASAGGETAETISITWSGSATTPVLFAASWDN